MRIIAGSLGGRRFSPPENLSARPTTDMAKEGLFDILSNRVSFPGLRALDMFCGTGSISLELASRGCSDIVAVEKNGVNFAYIRRNLSSFNVSCVNLLKGDAFKFIRSSPQPFDLVFADPPYDLPALPQIPSLVLGSGILKPDGLFILEHPRTFSFASHEGFCEHRCYGHVNFSFFRLSGAGGE